MSRAAAAGRRHEFARTFSTPACSAPVLRGGPTIPRRSIGGCPYTSPSDNARTAVDGGWAVRQKRETGGDVHQTLTGFAIVGQQGGRPL